MRLWLPLTVGVGQCVASIASDSRTWAFGLALLLRPNFAAVGVGQDKESKSLVWGADIRSAESAARNSVAEVFKVCRHHSESTPDSAADVFPENERTSCLVNDSEHFPPETRARTSEASALTCHAEVLAGASASDAIHDATPWAAIEGCNIVPDRRVTHGLVFHPRHESGCCEGLPLNVHHSFGSTGEGDSCVTHAGAGEEGANPRGR